jgi:tetraacyldisaccharide 4'-kinase
LPVICVGNFTAGGTGKTPLALAIAEHLIQRGEQPAFLTRGYGGRSRGPLWVEPERHATRDVGDEPLLLARRAPVMLARDRREGALVIEGGERPASVIVMDDGLQNPALHKDLTIALVDADRGVGNGRVIPAGPLRAPLEFQIALADAIVVNGTAAGAVEGAAIRRRVVDVLRREFTGPVLQATAAPSGDTGWLAGAKVVAFAGIGNPARFFRLLETLGAELAAREVFPDHHTFTEADAARLISTARDRAAHLVTTEKDWVRLATGEGRLAELRQAARTLPIRLAMPAADTARLADLLVTTVQTGGYRRGLSQR